MAVNTGDGVKESSKEKPDTVVHSEPLVKVEEKSTKRTKKITTPEEAADFLLSVLDEVKSAGMTVKGYNDKGRLILCIDGLNYSSGLIYPVDATGNKIGQTNVVQTGSVGAT